VPEGLGVPADLIDKVTDDPDRPLGPGEEEVPL
jgi:hypothetical protein